MNFKRIISLAITLCLLFALFPPVPLVSAASLKLKVGEITTVNISEAGNYKSILFEPTQGVHYRIRSFGDLDPWCSIYDRYDTSDGSLWSNDDYHGLNFEVCFDDECSKYIIDIGLHSTSSTGSFTILLEEITQRRDELPDPDWSIDDGVLTISGCGDMPDYYMYEAPWSSRAEEIEKISIQPGITGIGEYAFSSLKNVTRVYIPSTVTEIRSDAFSWCEGLPYIIIPNSVTYIGSTAFLNCRTLYEVQLPANLKALQYGTFLGCSNLKELIIPEGIEKVHSSNFESCSSLLRVTFPKSVKYISHSQFIDADSLQAITVLNPDCEIAYNEYSNDESDTCYIMYYSDSGIVPVVYGYEDTQADWMAGSALDYGGSEMTFEPITSDVSIAEHPVSYTINVGEQAVFTAEGNGVDVTYQWMFRPADREEWENAYASGDDTAAMTVPGTRARNGNQYRCRITDKFGQIVYTDIATLTVKENLTVSTQPKTQKVKAGTTATFQTAAKGSSLKYQWQYKTSAEGNWLNCTAEGNKTATLKVSATTGKSSYYYRCQIKDNGGNTIYTNVVRLYVLGIKQQPTTQKVKAGTTATFKVSATGSNKTYQWQYKTSSDGKWLNCTAEGNKTATLKVAATTGKSSYYYRCKITDSAGNVIYTNVVRLYVLGIKTQPAAKTAKAGTTAKFTVAATGAGKTYQWQYKAPNGTWKNTTATGAKTATLSISVTAAKNGYQYRCIVKDNAGNSVTSKTAKLTVK